MREFTIEYLAGFFDGEGHVSVMRCRGGKNARLRYWLRIGVSCTHPTVVQEFKARFGGSVHLRIRRSERHSPCYDWVAQHRVAADALMILRPFLLVKQRDAELGLEFQRVIRTYPKSGHKRYALDSHEILVREAVRRDLIEHHGLASRGVLDGE